MKFPISRPFLIRLADKSLVAPWLWLAQKARALRSSGAGAAKSSGASPSGTWVVIKLVGMGDAVLALPVLAAIRNRPGCRLVALTTPRCGPVWTAPGSADPPGAEAIVVRDWPSLLSAVRALRHCDGVLDLEQHVYWSAALAMLAPRRARRYGFEVESRLRNRSYDIRVSPGPDIRHMKEIFDDLARAAGFAPEKSLLPLPVSAEARRRAGAWMRERGVRSHGFLVIAPGSGATVAFRRLPAEVWEQILGGLPPELDVVLVGTSLEEALIGEIQARAAARPGAGRVLAGTRFRLQELAELFSQAWKVVAIDNGPMHLAAAMGVPVVGIFGPDSPLRYRPYNSDSVSVSLGLPCSPCNNCWVYREARCTNPEQYACMQRQSPAAILAAIGRPPGAHRGAGA